MSQQDNDSQQDHLLTPQEILVGMIAQGCSDATIRGFCQAHGLPCEPTPMPTVTVRPVAVSAPRPRRRKRTSKSGKTTKTATTSASRVRDRFDLQD